MSNMSYCRFENTLGDLRDCAQNLGAEKPLSVDEARARKFLVRICAEILQDLDLIDEMPSRESIDKALVEADGLAAERQADYDAEEDDGDAIGRMMGRNT